MPPSSPDASTPLSPDRALAAAHAIAAFGRETGGHVRPESLAALLAEHLTRLFDAHSTAICVAAGESGEFRILHAAPEAGVDHTALLDAARHLGPKVVTQGVGQSLQEAGHPPSDSIPGSWLGVPLTMRHRVIGAISVGAAAGRLGATDLVLAEALAAQAAIALECARLTDLRAEGQRTWEDVADAIPLALCLIDRQGRVRRANRAFGELVHVPAAGIVGRPWLTLVPPAWGQGLRGAIEAAGTGREVELHANDRTFAITAYPIAPSDSTTLVLLFDDQTERRRLQDQLIQSEKMSAIGQLIAGVAHDLNNPLTSVVGFADFLADAPDAPERLREPLRVIQQEAERASSIVRNLLGFARKQDRQRRATALRPLLEATLGLLRNQLMAHQVEARLELERDLPDLDIDSNQIQQVFVNLINNAAQAIAGTGKPGTVVVRARRWTDGVAVDVIDDGPGMTEELAAQAFEPFFTTKSEGEGTGLGLSISQGIVKEHGGRIMLATAPGKGATFTVELPAQSRPAQEPEVEEPRPAPAPARLRVLVVDDEPHILHYMRTTLEAWGHTVEVASDGQEALARATQGGLDLIISDLRMPRLNGREFFQELERRDPDIARRLVFSTGDTVRGDTLAFLERRGQPYLHKPFSLTELRSLLSRVPNEPPSPVE